MLDVNYAGSIEVLTCCPSWSCQGSANVDPAKQIGQMHPLAGGIAMYVVPA